MRSVHRPRSRSFRLNVTSATTAITPRPEYRFASRDTEAVFVCFAGGAEKLLKLTAGMFAVDDHEGWPTKATMNRPRPHR